MTHDPLEALLRLRRMAVDEARRGLAECLRQEADAATALDAIEASIARETAAAGGLAADDADVEAFARWLRRMLPEQHAAQAAEEDAEAATARARAVLAAARAAVRAAETMLEQHAATARANAQRGAQAEIDEAALRSRGQRDVPGRSA
jgi:flagellar export protein FliJ